MKTIYFVRHGQTEANVKELIQGPDSELDSIGLIQAEKIAERTRNIDVDVLISSDFRRARDTAATIARQKGMSVEISTLFQETIPPTSFYGVPRTSEEYQAYTAEWRENMANKEWRFEDGENIYDIITRSVQALDFLKGRSETSMLVVTHGNFLKYIVSTMTLGDDVDVSVRKKMHDAIYLSNTGMTLAQYVDDQWRLITLNDIAHLGE